MANEKSRPFLGPRAMTFQTLEELRAAITEFERIAREDGHTPDTVHFSDTFELVLVSKKLSDSSIVMDMRLRIATPPIAYVIACTVHGGKRYYDGADFIRDRQRAIQYATEGAAKRVAREQSYACTVESVS